MPGWLVEILPWVITAAHVVPAILAAGHAILYRRDSRAALLWVGLIWLAPLLGAVLYWVFGRNRIRRKARLLRAGLDPMHTPPGVAPLDSGALAGHLPEEAAHLVELDRLAERILVRPLLPGNRVEPLAGGDEAYPAMWEAIDSAETSIALSTFIFDADPVGRKFVEKLGAAVRRGVEVRVLVDDTGARHSFPRIWSALRGAEVPHARFHPRLLVLPRATLNIRNHRKILVVDGRTGFTGGMNIREGHLASAPPRERVEDLHFRVSGPVVSELMEVFAEDWLFTTEETLGGPTWFPSLTAEGSTIARGIADGPDEDLGKMSFILRGALHAARRSVRIATPYFLPGEALVSALNIAALRGVEVDLVLPEKGNVLLVRWATRSMLWQVLEHGVRVWFSPAPFDHTKLVVVDDQWTFFGSTNWDPRSLRLNFEFNVEACDAELAREAAARFDEKRARARPVTLEEMDGRALPARLRDGIARLCTPLL